MQKYTFHLIGLIGLYLISSFSITFAQTPPSQDKVLFIAVGDTEDRLHHERGDDFKVAIGEESKKSIKNIERVVRSIPGLRTTPKYFTGKNFSRKQLEDYFQKEAFAQDSDSASVIICYVVTHGEADIDLKEELPIVHFPEGKFRTVDLRNSLKDDDDKLVLLLVEACNHEPISSNEEANLKAGDGSSQQMLFDLFNKQKGYIEIVSARKSYKSYVTRKGGLLALYFSQYLLEEGGKLSWSGLEKYLYQKIPGHQITGEWLRDLNGNQVKFEESFVPYIDISEVSVKE